MPRVRVARRARDVTAGLTVTRLANGTGVVTFAGTTYPARRGWARTFIDVSIVAGPVQLSKDGKLIRIHPIRYDRVRELGAFANPRGRPRRKNSAIGYVAQLPEPERADSTGVRKELGGPAAGCSRRRRCEATLRTDWLVTHMTTAVPQVMQARISRKFPPS